MFVLRALGVGVLVVLAGCGSRPPEGSSGPPFDVQLGFFAAAHGVGRQDALELFFARGARLQSPVMPRAGSAADYLRTLVEQPFGVQISRVEILYAGERGAKTRALAQMAAPGVFSLGARMEVLWVYEDAAWRIAQIEYPDWPAVAGVWRKAGGEGEPSIELRILPGGNYLLFASRERSEPTVRGTWAYAKGALRFTDTIVAAGERLDRSTGTYAAVVGGSGMNLRLIGDDHNWRADRFPGLWSAGR